MNNCSYTAQGNIVCNKPIIESFIINEKPNETLTKDTSCTLINNEFNLIANKYKCNINSDINNCIFTFTNCKN
jgi:hypothetical protein